MKWQAIFPAALLLVCTACGAQSSQPKAPAVAASPSPTSPSPTTPAAQPASPAPSAKPTHAAHAVTLVLNYIPEGYHAPYYVALKKGFYKAAGLNVTIHPGSGSNIALQQVANKAVTFGLTSASVVVLGINKGMSVRMVAAYMQKTPLSVISLASEHLTRPKQLRGLRIGDPPGTSSSKLLPAFLGANGMSLSDVHLDSVSAHALRSLLLTHKIDAYNSYGMTEVPALADKGVHVNAMNWANWGFHMLSQGLVANLSTIKNDPQEVKAFLKATAEGFRFSEQHPKQAVAIMRAMVPNAHLPKGTVQTLTLSLKLLHTTASKGHPIGWMAPGDWTSTVNTMKKYEGLKSAKPTTDYYTDAFTTG